LDRLQGDPFYVGKLDFFEVPEVDSVGIAHELGHGGSEHQCGGDPSYINAYSGRQRLLASRLTESVGELNSPSEMLRQSGYFKQGREETRQGLARFGPSRGGRTGHGKDAALSWNQALLVQEVRSPCCSAPV
jgi:hypothetical protein